MLKRCAQSFVTSRDCSLAFAAIETAGSSQKIHYWAWESLCEACSLYGLLATVTGGSKSLNGEVAKIPFTHYNRDRFGLVWFTLAWLRSMWTMVEPKSNPTGLHLFMPPTRRNAASPTPYYKREPGRRIQRFLLDHLGFSSSPPPQLCSGPTAEMVHLSPLPPLL